MSIVAWMIHAAAVGLVLAAGAWCLDRGLTGLGLPSRWVWAGALVVSVGIPGTALLFQGPGGAPVPAGGEGEAVPVLLGSAEGMRGAAPQGDAGPWIAAPLRAVGDAVNAGVGRVASALPAGPGAERWAVALWGVASAAFAAFVLLSVGRMARRRRGWPRGELLGRTVRLSPDVGPAVAGVLRPEIVLPSWARRLPAEELEWVLVHEEEHARARDPLLLALGLVPIALLPWNPALWLQLQGLRDAVEVDCDRRVLARGAVPRRYGRLLLRLGSRSRSDLIPAPAISGSFILLERRLKAMRKRSLKTTLPPALLGGAAAALLLAVACETDTPTPPVDEAAPGLDEAAPGLRGVEEAVEPHFTPYEVAPEVTNAQEVSEALRREYPPLLRDAGVGGRTVLHIFIDEEGRVANALVADSSGREELDGAALRVAEAFEFAPALLDGEPRAVWVQIPITFQAREE